MVTFWFIIFFNVFAFFFFLGLLHILESDQLILLRQHMVQVRTHKQFDLKMLSFYMKGNIKRNNGNFLWTKPRYLIPITLTFKYYPRLHWIRDSSRASYEGWHEWLLIGFKAEKHPVMGAPLKRPSFLRLWLLFCRRLWPGDEAGHGAHLARESLSNPSESIWGSPQSWTPSPCYH